MKAQYTKPLYYGAIAVLHYTVYRQCVKITLVAILAESAARLPIWQAKTPSKEEASQAGLQ